MKKTFIILFFILSSSLLTLRAQSWLWGVGSKGGFGDVNYDHCIATDNAGNSYLTGLFRDTISFGPYTLNGVNNPYGFVFLVKYDVNGNIIWAKQSTAPSSSCEGISKSMATDNSGNVYVGGTFVDTATFGAYTLKESTDSTPADGESFLVKYDAGGNVLWAKQGVQANAASVASISSIAVDNLGNIYVTGFNVGTTTLGSIILNSSANGDVFVAKYNSAGNVIWANQANLPGPASAAQGYSIALDKNANVYVTGYYIDSVSFGPATLKGRNIFLAKYDSAGNMLWATQPANGWGFPCSLAVDRASDIYLSGAIEQTITFGTFTLSTPYYYTGYNSALFLAKYTPAGNVIWAKQGYCNDSTIGWVVYSLSCDTLSKGGGYMAIVGTTFPASTNFNLTYATDTFKYGGFVQTASILINFDSTGNVACGNIFSEGFEDDGDGICVDRSGKYVFYGGDAFGLMAFGPDTLNGDDAPFVARWQPCGLSEQGINGLPDVGNNGVLFPNPNNGKFTIQLASSYQPLANSSAVIYNMLGEKIYSKQWTINNGQLTIDIGSKPSGVYLYRIITETGDLVSEGKFVIE